MFLVICVAGAKEFLGFKLSMSRSQTSDRRLRTVWSLRPTLLPRISTKKFALYLADRALFRRRVITCWRLRLLQRNSRRYTHSLCLLTSAYVRLAFAYHPHSTAHWISFPLLSPSIFCLFIGLCNGKPPASDVVRRNAFSEFGLNCTWRRRFHLNEIYSLLAC